ncbi:AAEL005395-PA [Aedes aegypti]|uniref:tRNA-queuosine alpha-mannosyltransferase n=2 Tax=Aedes aegypti TaxID=7159 RepID=A0A1S4FAE4_AEDAE|nr:glycosyltransferase-like domain-containing protein 1-like [Aedes aegypti]EAT43143.1 AAEL005395-PA [Aedes aegypti]
MAKVLIIEPFYGGSHKQLLDTFLQQFHPAEYDLFTLTAKKWHWRSRIGALYFSETIPRDHQYKTLFTSSVLNLAELIGLRPDLAICRKIVYFHENQLNYPVREIKERDCQYGLNQIMTCLSADQIVFNSQYNKISFLDNIKSFLNIAPDLKLKNLREKLEPRCEVLYFPIPFHSIPKRIFTKNDKPLHLIWPHRWEHDKNPQFLTNTLLELNKRQVDFRVSILGERAQSIPECFENIGELLKEKLINFGFLSKDEYYRTLLDGDVVISTAGHEFYGVAMLEAAYCGCLPVAPNKLVYPEIYPDTSLYNTSNQLIKMLYNWCKNRHLFERDRAIFYENFDFDKYSAVSIVPKFISMIRAHLGTPGVVNGV